MLTPDGDSVDPLIETLPAGSTLYRVHSTVYSAATFHPGSAPARPSARFSFFGDPPVPTLYAAETVDAALNETILREIPLRGGAILLDQIEALALSPRIIQRDVRLLQLHGHGFRHVKAAPAELTLSSPFSGRRASLHNRPSPSRDSPG
ncbi:RES family NAD+ phosphorylase [Citricoccus sp. NPDC055426]|uniref:RES family NAD+ phosphorylase n=1 Tax=Citricoccus sp. NPDC055426 TaxID=3155536 RepID=UPI003430E0C5